MKKKIIIALCSLITGAVIAQTTSTILHKNLQTIQEKQVQAVLNDCGMTNVPPDGLMRLIISRNNAGEIKVFAIWHD